MSFKTAHSFEDRLVESSKIREKFPGRIPIIVERASRATNVPPLDRVKFLVPGDLNIGQFIFVIRKRILLSSDQAMFLFVGHSLPTTGALLSELYASHKDADGFLYAQYSGESTFGGL